MISFPVAIDSECLYSSSSSSSSSGSGSRSRSTGAEPGVTISGECDRQMNRSSRAAW